MCVYVHVSVLQVTDSAEGPLKTHLCAFMKIFLFLQLYQLIIGGSSPDVKASIR